MKLFRNFSYLDKASHFPFLVNYPTKVTNYEIDPYSGIYRLIENFLESDSRKGFWITAVNPIDSGSLFVPMALGYGFNYISLLDLVGRDEEGMDRIFHNPEPLIINDVNDENPRLGWVFEKLATERFNQGRKTFFGSTKYMSNITNKYQSGGITAKVNAMSEFRIVIEEPLDAFVEANNPNHKVKLEGKYEQYRTP